jgi:hypothetical protein
MASGSKGRTGTISKFSVAQACWLAEASDLGLGASLVAKCTIRATAEMEPEADIQLNSTVSDRDAASRRSRRMTVLRE